MLGVGLKVMSIFFSIQYAKELTKIKRGKEESLQKKLQVAQIGFQQNLREEFEEILNKCKLELEKVLARKLMD